jgi:alpha,alpha-trehalose phosphorylase
VATRRLEIPPEHLYPIDEWCIREARYCGRYFARAETAFSLANGYVGIRGTFDEGRPSLSAGTFVNGFHETWPIVHAEEAFGLARTGQTIVNVPDATVIRLYVDDEPLFVPTARLRRYERVLDMRAGTLSRELEWSTAAGKHVTVRSSRMVSLEHRHLVAIEYEVVLREAAPVTIASQIVNRQDGEHGDGGPPRRGSDPRLARRFDHRVLHPDIAEAAGGWFRLGYHTLNSGMTLAVAAAHTIDIASP